MDTKYNLIHPVDFTNVIPDPVTVKCYLQSITNKITYNYRFSIKYLMYTKELVIKQKGVNPRKGKKVVTFRLIYSQNYVYRRKTNKRYSKSLPLNILVTCLAKLLKLLITVKWNFYEWLYLFRVYTSFICCIYEKLDTTPMLSVLGRIQLL